MSFRVLAVAVLCSVASAASAEVHVTMNGGQVSISAKDATVAQILAEWAKVGQTRIVNGERLRGAPMTIELSHVPEIQALEILLRGAGGYVIAPRSTPATSAAASAFDRIFIVPTSSGTPPTVAPPPAPPASSRIATPINRDEEANDAPASGQTPAPGGGAPPRFAPITSAEPDPAVPRPASPPFAPGPTLGVVPGVDRPGMPMPAPPTNDQNRR